MSAQTPPQEPRGSYEAFCLKLNVVSPLDCAPGVTEEARRRATYAAARTARDIFRQAVRLGIV